MSNAPGGVTGVRTGFPSLDRMTGGLQPHELHIVAARPSVRKTAYAGQVAVTAALVHNVPTTFVTLEQPRKQLLLRMASNLARVDLVAVRHGTAPEAALSDLSKAMGRLHAAPLTFVDHRDLKMSDVRRRARALHADGRCGS